MYLKAHQDAREARIGLGNYFRFYNTERPHQAIGYRTPAQVEANNGIMVESLTLNPLRMAGHNLNTAPILS